MESRQPVELWVHEYGVPSDGQKKSTLVVQARSIPTHARENRNPATLEENRERVEGREGDDRHSTWRPG